MRKPLRDRLHAKTDYGDGAGCWLWTGSRVPFGHGRIQSEGGERGVLLAHRVAYELKNGPIPTGMCVRHTCDVPACVRPDHLRVGTKAENTADMMSRGRHVPAGCPGVKNASAKLTDTQVLEIRWLIGRVTGVEISAMFGISQSLVSAIKHNKNWKHIGRAA